MELWICANTPWTIRQASSQLPWLETSPFLSEITFPKYHFSMVLTLFCQLALVKQLVIYPRLLLLPRIRGWSCVIPNTALKILAQGFFFCSKIYN